MELKEGLRKEHVFEESYLRFMEDFNKEERRSNKEVRKSSGWRYLQKMKTAIRRMVAKNNINVLCLKETKITGISGHFGIKLM